ncbi:hypothetical protein MCOR24_001736 [Pyricularia oryzae]|nr:hypothetical protein MCOR24_001736 [Pyricularia oryzae]
MEVRNSISGQRETAADSTIMAFDPDQRYILSTLERVGGALSLVGVSMIFVTFYASKRIRTVPNTFILFASIANVGACVASLIALEGIEQGETSPLCQTQAFLFEMFMQSDPWWSFAMAINVYLVFFWSTNPTSFRKHLWIYCAICFGVPAVPAFICLFYRPGGAYIYGDAILWCWIDNNFNQLRIWTYYLPIWVCIFLSAVIYVAVGYQVFHQRNQLRNLTLSNPGKETSTSDVRDSAEKNLTGHGSYYGTVTTEVQVTTMDHCCDAHTTHSITPPPTPPNNWNSNSNTTLTPTPCYHPWVSTATFPFDLEACNGSGPSQTNFNTGTNQDSFAQPGPLPRPLSPCGNPNCHYANIPNAIFPIPPPASPTTKRQATASSAATHRSSPPPQPQTFSTTSVITAAPRPKRRSTSRPSVLTRVQSSGHRITAKLRHMDPVKLAYLRTSFVFAISVLVTWTPSSINRVYNLVYPEQASYGLNLASAAVLPLQGVWNAVIYFSTSHKILREELEVVSSRRPVLRRVLTWLRMIDPSSVHLVGVDGGSLDRARSAGVVSGSVCHGGPSGAVPPAVASPAFERTTTRGGRLSRHYSSDAVEMNTRNPRIGSNVRVQKGGQLDISL